MRLITQSFFLLFVLLSFIQASNPISSTVKLTSHQGKTVLFKIKSSKLEWVNGQLSLALLSTDNKLIQLNNINEKWLKDTTFRSSSISYLMIDSSRTFINSKRLLPLIEIECEEVKKGKPVKLRAHGRIYYNRIWYTTTIVYDGVLPERRFLSQYKKSTDSK